MCSLSHPACRCIVLSPYWSFWQGVSCRSFLGQHSRCRGRLGHIHIWARYQYATCVCTGASHKRYLFAVRHKHNKVFGCLNQSSSPDFTSFSSCASLTTSFCIRFSSRAPEGNYQHRLTPLRTIFTAGSPSRALRVIVLP